LGEIGLIFSLVKHKKVLTYSNVALSQIELSLINLLIQKYETNIIFPTDIETYKSDLSQFSESYIDEL
jgi:hypothetical protein